MPGKQSRKDKRSAKSGWGWVEDGVVGSRVGGWARTDGRVLGRRESAWYR